MSSLIFRERPADGEPRGLLVLHHGRGADENDLPALGDALDPSRRLHLVTPRAPLQLPGWSGQHWYVVPRVGYPDPETFSASYALLAELHEELWRLTGLSARQTVLGGFSMGAAMSYALALGADRPAPAGILAFSGFVPKLDEWQPQLADRTGTRAFIAHGAGDPVIGVELAREARDRLGSAGLPVEYHEFDGAHQIDPALLPLAGEWLAQTIS